MFFGGTSAVGLDIGSSYVKAVQLRRVGKTGINLDRFGIAEVFPGGDKTATGTDIHERKVKAVRTALSEAGITAKQVVCAVGGESIIARYIQLPEMPEAELRNALRWEAEDHIPFPLDEVNLDSVVLGKAPEGDKVDVLLVAAKKELVNSHLQILRDARLSPVVVDVDSFAFLNCFELNHSPSPNEVFALMNIGAEVTSINIYTDGVSRLTRDISIAGDAVTRSIQAKMAVDWAQAEQVKIQSGVPQGEEQRFAAQTKVEPTRTTSLLDTIHTSVGLLTQEKPGEEGLEGKADQVIRSTLANLVGEVRRSFQFFENQPRGRPVQKVVIGGGTARMGNLDRYLSAELGLPVEFIDPLRRISVAKRGINATALEASKLMLGVSVGLALRKVI